ncbi:hypothetical protein GJ744_001206 [Endocarpon pusillum]|uniref:Uncharacterized protein n=1 Tax=Endocarpon pusillum TaxID=364733 RepID=A0A8H7A9M2_9EURO|nr:hypothetical protein GJ744_001206 [Endocarpon pusillum]
MPGAVTRVVEKTSAGKLAGVLRSVRKQHNRTTQPDKYSAGAGAAIDVVLSSADNVLGLGHANQTAVIHVNQPWIQAEERLKLPPRGGASRASVAEGNP